MTSACVSAIVRLYYSVKTQDSINRTSLLSKSILWTLSEISSGILAVCLPLSLKFFRSLEESSLWLNLKSTLQSFARLKSPDLWTVGTYSGEQAATKGIGRWSTVKKRFRIYSHVDNLQATQNGQSMEMHSVLVASTSDVVSTNQLKTPPTARTEFGHPYSNG